MVRHRFENGRAEVVFDDMLPSFIDVFLDPAEYGYKSSRIERLNERNTILLKPLEKSGPLGWWHQLHGVQATDGGSGVRIGIIDDYIDDDFARQNGVIVIDPAVIGVAPEVYGNGARSDHAAKVVSLIASKDTSGGGFVGTAPGAETFFLSARNWMEHHDHVALDPVLIAGAIEHLAEQCKCDLITISAGDPDRLFPEVLDAISYAQSLGTVCFFGSGNDGRPVYPASYEECLGVAAMGRYGTVHSDEAGWYDQEFLAYPIDDDYFCWSGSGIGRGIELLAAGVNLTWTKDGEPAGRITGTSFASPVAAGVSAVLLSSSREAWQSFGGMEKWNKVVEILLGNCDIIPVEEFDACLGILRAAR
ncbi:S8/S53 family peptidase [Rhizobium leguminosarum]|uniref:S8 family peptidase n=1 Tax=Rhizobium leguminosarum TaxID=384 RepID=UPI001C9382CE|nr:S8/S53 family peptidase [Rhizobium leguminosarum]MBY5399463.1 S8/S53 family peptidase [Rhizobium leguminosarum]